MKKMLSMILAILIVIISAVPCLAQPYNPFNIYAESVNCSKNEIIDIPVYIENNNGMMGFKIIFNYDKDFLEPVSVQRGEAIPNGMLSDSVGVQNNGEFYVVWSNSENIGGNGILFTLKFKVLNTSGSNTEIYMTYSQDDTFNEDWNDVELNCNDILLNVSDGSGGQDEPTEEPDVLDKDCSMIYAEESFADIGEELSVPIRIKNNPGLMGYKLKFEFDEGILSPQEVLPSGVNGSIDNNVGLHSDYFSVVWNSTENYCDDGILFYIIFDVLEKVPTEVIITYSPDDTFNEDWDEVEVECIPLKVNCDYIYSVCEFTTVNYNEKTISGINIGESDISDYIDVIDGYTYSLEMNCGQVHTSAKVVVKNNNNEIVDIYRIIVSGDVNCDGFTDGMDAVIINCIVNDMFSLEDIENELWTAADCNHDDVIDEKDVALLDQAGLVLASVDQSKSPEELMTDSAYVEYLSLIDQNQTEKTVE